MHGARIAAEVVGNPELFDEWKSEMEYMAGRIKVGLLNGSPWLHEQNTHSLGHLDARHQWLPSGIVSYSRVCMLLLYAFALEDTGALQF